MTATVNDDDGRIRRIRAIGCSPVQLAALTGLLSS